MPRQIEMVVFDMEGTLTADPTVWEIMHRKVGTWDSHGLPYWESFRAGRIGYDDFARMDVATWRGARLDMLEHAVAEVPLMAGCAELFSCLSERGIRTAIVTNGLERLAKRLAREFAIDAVLANREVVSDGRLTGDLEILVPFAHKGGAVRRLAEEMGLPMTAIMAVGDGPADVEMFRCCARSVAFRPHDENVAAAADHVVREPDLAQLLPLLS